MHNISNNEYKHIITNYCLKYNQFKLLENYRKLILLKKYQLNYLLYRDSDRNYGLLNIDLKL